MAGAARRGLGGAADRTRTVAVGRTHGRGLTLIDGRIPARFTLRTTGGFIGRRRFGGHLLAAVQRYRRGRVLVVNPATTLATRLCDDRRSGARVRCDRRVRGFLGLTRGTGLGAGLIGRRQFDGRRFLVVARRYRGVTRYLRVLQRELERHPRATHDFHGHESKRSVHSRLPAPLRHRRVVHGQVMPAAGQDDEDSWLSTLVGVAGQAGKAGQLVYQL